MHFQVVEIQPLQLCTYKYLQCWIKTVNFCSFFQIKGATQYGLGKKTKGSKVKVKLEPECITLDSDDDSERRGDETQGIDGDFSQQVADSFDQNQEDQNTDVPAQGHQRSDSVGNEKGIDKGKLYSHI